jgi:hypothetical protein
MGESDTILSSLPAAHNQQEKARFARLVGEVGGILRGMAVFVRLKHLDPYRTY